MHTTKSAFNDYMQCLCVFKGFLLNSFTRMAANTCIYQPFYIQEGIMPGGKEEDGSDDEI